MHLIKCGPATSQVSTQSTRSSAKEREEQGRRTAGNGEKRRDKRREHKGTSKGRGRKAEKDTRMNQVSKSGIQISGRLKSTIPIDIARGARLRHAISQKKRSREKGQPARRKGEDKRGKDTKGTNRRERKASKAKGMAEKAA